MLRIFYGDDTSEIYKKVSEIKKQYNTVTLVNNYFETSSLFMVVNQRSVFDKGIRLFVLYGLSIKNDWLVKLVLSTAPDTDLVLVFDKIDKRSKVWKSISKGAECTELPCKKDSIFFYIDKILAGDIDTILSNYEAFREEYESVEKLLFLLFRHLFILLRIKSLSARGISDSDMADTLKINKYFFGKYKREALNTKQEFLLDSLSFLKWVKKQLQLKYSGEGPVIKDETLINAILLWFLGGGSNSKVINVFDNLQPLWAKDNLSKGSKYLEGSKS